MSKYVASRLGSKRKQPRSLTANIRWLYTTTKQSLYIAVSIGRYAPGGPLIIDRSWWPTSLRLAPRIFAKRRRGSGVSGRSMAPRGPGLGLGFSNICAHSDLTRPYHRLILRRPPSLQTSDRLIEGSRFCANQAFLIPPFRIF